MGCSSSSSFAGQQQQEEEEEEQHLETDIKDDRSIAHVAPHAEVVCNMTTDGPKDLCDEERMTITDTLVGLANENCPRISSPVTYLEQREAIKVNLADFEMDRTLGCGSFGRVSMAKYKQDGKFYAMKLYKKHEIIKLGKVDHIKNEKRLMAQISYPFVVKMVGYTKSDYFVYIIMEMIAGGELYTHLRRARKFSDEQSKFYGLQTAGAFAHIHSKNIIHRELKPENILMCPNGYSKLTHFGSAKIIEPGTRTYTLCGTPEYLAPEVLLNKGHGKPVDWWALGILIYEMICGQPPFCDEDTPGIYQKILAGKVYFPKYFDKNAKALVSKLLTADSSKRYGNLKDGPADILKCEWFSAYEMDKMEKQEYPAPYNVGCKDENDTSNFEYIPDPKELPQAVPASQDPFTDW
eukprot:TRINITY_DN12326_c0_g2_i1.p1 TRINITY_DN12326_c0_g2~~TRINITY_DN12326_c0_g2_i1.p1  ORF type:complete len:408 (+),score=100.42 TRINITY_DN12326_c0_g2_i1:84-1307(+)